MKNIFIIFVIDKRIKYMAKLVLPIGISGSGKSYIYNRDYKDCVQVSPDLIREELTGDISNQSKNKEV